MPTSEEYEFRVKSLDQSGLTTLWEAILERKTPDWDPGKALEYVIVRAFELEGAEVSYPYSVFFEDEETEQVDGLVHVQGLSCLIECKDILEKANIEPIAKMRNQLLRRPSLTIGSIFSRSGFTDPALVLAQFNAPQTILLWSNDEIDYCIRERFFTKGLVQKFRYCIQHGKPNYNVRVGELP